MISRCKAEAYSTYLSGMMISPITGAKTSGPLARESQKEQLSSGTVDRWGNGGIVMIFQERGSWVADID